MSSDWQKEAKRCQSEWAKILHSWKYFENEDDLVKTYLGICLFGFVESEEIENSSLRKYHLNYKESQRTHIDKIFAHLVSLSGHQIELGHTFLYLNENCIVYCVFRFRIKNKIFFIEPNGRFYNSWVHFLDTNELPACQFLAPKNGVYGKPGELNEIVCYQTSGSKKWFSKSLSIMDWVCAVAGIGCTLLGVFSLAPGVAASAAITVGAKNMHKAVSNFLDQEEHRQLNALGSVNGAISLATVTMSALSGASKTYEMISLAGEHGILSLKILQSLNFTNRLIDAGYFGTYLLHLSCIARKGRVSDVDALELAAQIFILHGAVVDVKHLHGIINCEKKIARNDLACGFNEWKYKLNKSGVHVKDCHPLVGLKLLANRCKNPLQILSKFYSREELILNTCFDLEHFTLDYLCDKISINQFCSEIRPLFVNFSYFHNNYYEELTNLVRYFVGPLVNEEIPENDYKDICKLLVYATSVIKKIEPESDPIPVEKIVEKSAIDVSESDSETTENYKILIDAAKSLVVKKNIYVSIDQVIKSCHDSILFTTTKLSEIITEAYNSMVDFNRGVVGEDRLQIILERVHASTVDEYFHHDEAFKNFVKKFKTETESLPGHEFVPVNPSKLPDYEVEEISDKVMNLYESAYSLQTRSKKLSLQDTMNTLQKISANWNEKLDTKMNTPCLVPAANATLYSQLNARLAEMSVDESIDIATFRRSLKDLESDLNTVSEFQSFGDYILIRNHVKLERSDSQLCEALVIICSNFYYKIASALNDEQTSKVLLLRKVFHFVISKFLTIMDTEVKVLENQDDSRSIFSLYPKSRFYSTILRFDDIEYLDKLKPEFENWPFDNVWSYDKIDIWKGIIDSDLFHLRVIRCTKQDCKEFYKSISSELFDITVDHEYDVLINVSSVFLKSLRKFIIFNYVNDCDVIVTSLNLKLNI
ncbi:uncharacterized protein LOC135833374 [Planococcus citri]|uniref:uncharacterized protein LOC135833374 n=1 Tax=Planococcus citri TaxID=170843 RepID=UPI0031F8786D